MGLKSSKDVAELMKSYKKKLMVKEKSVFWVNQYDSNLSVVSNKIELDAPRLLIIDNKLKSLHRRVLKMGDDVFERRGISKHDVIEQIGATLDTIMSLNINYGAGHTKSYFKMAWNKEAEFIAHSFENAFAGNEVFKKYLPELYNDMVLFIESLKPI